MIQDREETTYYVYRHVEPRIDDLHVLKGETVYIGHGRGSRAWHLGAYRTDPHSRGVGRNYEHAVWASDLINEGYLPPDIVHIEMKGLTKKEAMVLENKLIWDEKPRFNRLPGKALCALNEEEVELAFELREEHGLSYKKIAEELGVTAMTIHRLINGNVKNYG